MTTKQKAQRFIDMAKDSLDCTGPSIKWARKHAHSAMRHGAELEGADFDEIQARLKELFGRLV